MCDLQGDPVRVKFIHRYLYSRTESSGVKPKVKVLLSLSIRPARLIIMTAVLDSFLLPPPFLPQPPEYSAF